MTFEEAFERLNQGDIASVAAEMTDWHPAILGNMLLAVQAAKRMRYLSPHPDYYSALRACVAVEPKLEVGQYNAKFSKGRIKIAVDRLLKEAAS